jgi:hypothetical protein
MIFKNLRRRQAGASLMEVLVAMSISLVVTASMVALMANSLGTTSRIVKMTKLSDDMRVAMQMMTRDLRRSNYNANSILCYGNEDCATDGTITSVGDINLVDRDSDGANDCFWFLTDRHHDDYSTAAEAGGFRRVPVGGVGVIEMWTGGATPNCNAAAGAAGWVGITDPGDMDITTFIIDDSLSYDDPGLVDADGNPVQRVRKLRMSLQGQLVVDPTVWRRVEDVINVRNDLIL